jgi:hypothetical protein
METIHENLKEDPKEEEEEVLNMENAFYPEQSSSEEDQSDRYASFVSFNFFCLFLFGNQSAVLYMSSYKCIIAEI